MTDPWQRPTSEDQKKKKRTSWHLHFLSSLIQRVSYAWGRRKASPGPPRKIQCHVIFDQKAKKKYPSPQKSITPWVCSFVSPFFPPSILFQFLYPLTIIVSLTIESIRGKWITLHADIAWKSTLCHLFVFSRIRELLMMFTKILRSGKVECGHSLRTFFYCCWGHVW